MRENMGLYRGKRLDNGKWVQGFYCKHDTVKVCFTTDDPKSKHLIIMDGFCDWGFEPPLQGVEVDPDTVGQCSGMEDKNAKPIFEGDVVICSLIGCDIYHPPYSWNRKRVVYERGAFCVEDLSGDTAPLHDYAPGFEIEVIGNIHDNPELQEV